MKRARKKDKKTPVQRDKTRRTFRLDLDMDEFLVAEAGQRRVTAGQVLRDMILEKMQNGSP